MVHLDRLDFGGDVGGGEGDDHTGFLLLLAGVGGEEERLTITPVSTRPTGTVPIPPELRQLCLKEKNKKTNRSCKHPGEEVGEACR